MLILAHLDLKLSTLEKMMHENSEFGNFEDERRKLSDPVALYRSLIFIFTFAN